MIHSPNNDSNVNESERPSKRSEVSRVEKTHAGKRSLCGPIRPHAKVLSMLVPAFLVGTIFVSAQDAGGVKFRGSAPLAPVPPVNPGAPSEVELPEPQPVFPGSKIVDPKKPAVPTDITPTAPPATPPADPNATPPTPVPVMPDPATQLPDPVRVKKDTQQANPAEAQVLPDPNAMNVPPPPMPRVDVPQIENVNLFPTEQQQMEAAATELDKGWQLVWHGGVRAAWDSNIFIQNEGEESDFIVTFSPGMAIGIGEFRQELASPDTFRDRFDRSDAELGRRFFFLDYNPSYHLYTSNSGESSLEHDIRAQGRYTFTKLTLGATARFETLNVADSDIGERISMRRFNGKINADYAFSGKTTFEAQFDHSIRDYEGDRNDITEYRASAWVDYQALPKTNIALGYTHGWVDVDNGNSQDFDQVQLRVVWKATEKFSARASGGVEFRGIENGDDVTNGTFAVGLVYKPFDATSIFLNGFRRTTTSASGFNETYVTTGFDARVVQRFSQKYFVTAAGGFQSADYEENVAGFSRQDDYSWTRLSLGWDVNKWLTTMVAYEFRTNDSNNDKRSFDDHLFYVQFSFLF
jgi:hypothetical protein